jgi:hypothetical protein
MIKELEINFESLPNFLKPKVDLHGDCMDTAKILNAPQGRKYDFNLAWEDNLIETEETHTKNKA